MLVALPRGPGIVPRRAKAERPLMRAPYPWSTLPRIADSRHPEAHHGRRDTWRLTGTLLRGAQSSTTAPLREERCLAWKASAPGAIRGRRCSATLPWEQRLRPDCVQGAEHGEEID